MPPGGCNQQNQEYEKFYERNDLISSIKKQKNPGKWNKKKGETIIN